MVWELECRNSTFTVFIHYIVFTISSYVVINAGVVGCCTGLLLLVFQVSILLQSSIIYKLAINSLTVLLKFKFLISIELPIFVLFHFWIVITSKSFPR